jgi:hypothetical protein
MSTIQYSQSQAHFIWNGKIYGMPPTTYSGSASPYKNNPADQCVKGKGPLPRGFYKIGKMEPSHGSLGRHVIPLSPDGAAMCGRNHFYIHGDKLDPKKRGTASEGCIVTPYAIRKMIDDNHINELEVVL